MVSARNAVWSFRVVVDLDLDLTLTLNALIETR